MTKQEIIQKLAEMGIASIIQDISRHNRLEIPLHRMSGNIATTIASLEALGFSRTPMAMAISYEAETAKPATSKKIATRKETRAWLQAGGFADFIPCECGGRQTHTGDMSKPFGPCDKCGSTKQIWE